MPAPDFDTDADPSWGKGLSRRDAAVLRSLLDAIPGRVVVIAPDHRYLYVNEDWLQHFGMTLDDVVGRHPRDVVGEEAYARQGAFASQAQSRREPVRWEGWSTYADGSQRYIVQIFVPLLHEGEVTALVSFGRDLTDLREQERIVGERQAALEASEALNSAIVASALDCIIVTDEDGSIVEFNPAAEITFGQTREAALGRFFGELIVPPEHPGGDETGMRRYLDGASTFLGKRTELEAVRSDGTRFPVELTLTEVRLPRRRLFTAHFRDLTAARTAQAQILQQQERLHQVEKLSAMGSLLAGVAHELNNPLAILLAQATLLQEKAGTDDVRRRASRIHSAAERSSRIVKSFLAMARQSPPRREPVEIAEVVAAAVEMLAYGVRSNGITLEVQAQPGPLVVEGDRDLLGQVVANLLINAQQVLLGRPDPRIWIATKSTEEGVLLEVADNGPGVRPDIAERIFEPFFTTKPLGVGTGIGLSVCRNVVKAHGGRLTLDRHPSGGALFRVVLPKGVAREVADREVGPSPERILSVLVVDDEFEVGQSLAEVLSLLGHRTHVVDRASAALDAVEQHRFDAVFADLRMPDLGGVGLRERLAQTHPQLAARTVLMTGDTVSGLDSARVDASGHDVVVLEKPFAIADVRACLDQVLTRLAV
jgi:PAS domain S-box-containing protein